MCEERPLPFDVSLSACDFCWHVNPLFWELIFHHDIFHCIEPSTKAKIIYFVGKIRVGISFKTQITLEF